MSMIKADFTRRYSTYPVLAKLVLLLLSVVLFVLGLSHYQGLKVQIEQNIAAKQAAEISIEAPKSTPEQMAKFEALKGMQTELNMPWMVMLNELETLKSAYPDLVINSIQPSRENRKLKMTAKADDFGKVVDFIAAMRASGFFSSVNLVQHEDKNRIQQKARNAMIEFALLAKWEADHE